MIGYSKDRFTSIENIHLPADSIAVNRGYAAFDFFGIVNGKPFYLERHLDRFFRTMEIMRLEIAFSKQQVKDIVSEIVSRNQYSDFFIKLFAHPIETFSEPTIESEFYAVPVIIKSDSSFDYEHGIKLISKAYQRFLPEAKSTNYLPLVYWQSEIIEQKAVDVLYYSEGCIRETSRGNIFMVKDDIVYTPHEKILKGISRSIVLDILREKGISFMEQSIPLKFIEAADEVFLSSTTKLILPVTTIDSAKIRDGNVGVYTKGIMEAFHSIKLNWNIK